MMRSILFGLLAVYASANATPISFTVDGTVDTVTASLAGAGVAVGDAFSLTYTFESTTAPRAGNTSAAAPEIQADNAPGAPNDRYAVVSRGRGVDRVCFERAQPHFRWI